MRYRVLFDAPVVYLPSHLSGRREITELFVHADTPEAAKIHAIRVVDGPIGTLQVEEAESA